MTRVKKCAKITLELVKESVKNYYQTYSNTLFYFWRNFMSNNNKVGLEAMGLGTPENFTPWSVNQVSELSDLETPTWGDANPVILRKEEDKFAGLEKLYDLDFSSIDV